MKQTFVIQGVETEEAARQRANEWYAHKPNFSVDLVKPWTKGGFEVSISYDEETNTD